MADKVIKIKVIVEYGEQDTEDMKHKNNTWEQEEILLDPQIPFMREGAFLLTHKIQALGDKIVPKALKEITEKLDANS